MFHLPHGRRRFLQTAALFSAGLTTSLAYASLTRAEDGTPVPDHDIDAIVLGSGFGGAIAALRLGQAGIHTVLLERGRRWPIRPDGNTFCTFQKPDGRAAWFGKTTFDGVPIDSYAGLLALVAGDGITVLSGAGFGGGSLVYNAITYKPTRENFYRVFPAEVDYEELDSVYYPRVHSILHPSVIPSDILATPYYDTSRLLIEQGNKAGFRTYAYEINVDWNIVREEINGTKVPSAINGNHWYGLNSGAKNSLDRKGNYLPQAENTGFVEMLPLHVVSDIIEVPGHGYRVLTTQITERGEVVEQKSFTCRYLFVAAGSVGTSQLLVKAKGKGTLPNLNDEVGKYWGGNGDTLGTRSNLAPLDGKLVSGKGGPACVVLEDFDNPLGPIALEDIPNALGAEGSMQLLGLGISRQSGTFTYDASTDSVKLTWPNDSTELEATELTYRILDKRNATLNFQPKTEVFQGGQTPPHNSQVSGIFTGHALGGAVLGKACDLYGRVLNYQRLYVVDGALAPGSTGCANPSFTIAALAERCMDRILAEDIS